MLDREILLTNYGVSYGSVTLKSLQNDNVPELDLLVREAIQNSSDASLNENGDSFTVNFSTGRFRPASFNSQMSGLEEILNDLFPEESAEFLEIRDTKTSGLTGKLRKSEIKKDDHGNFFKLIYDTGKRQTISNAGGNWGFGKSVYYRVGIGIVVFYSRVFEEDGYEDRLILTLVEDEGKTDTEGNDNTLLNKLDPLSAGKAWWGVRDGEDLLPLTLSEQIKPILDIFGIKPFGEEETGTSIIIPYINEKRLLDGIIPVEDEIQEDIKEHFVSVWASTLSDYLRLSIQKWYSPKIHNRELLNIPGCDKKWLLVTVDNKPIKKQDLLPFFALAQELYTTAFAKTMNYEYRSKIYQAIETYPINIRNYLDGGMTAGYVSAIKISKSELAAHSAMSPYDYIGRFEADGGLNEPIMMYARDPGMIIEYAITGPWVKNITPPDNPNEYLFAFFVPDTKKRIKSDLAVRAYASKELGEYLRECEASDHMGWSDPVTMQIVKRLQTNSINQINAHMKPSIESDLDATTSKLSNKVGRCLLPRIGYGKTKAGGNGKGNGNGTKLHNIEVLITSQTIKNNIIDMDYSVRLSHGKKTGTLSLLVASESGWINAETWEKEIGTVFPVKIEECYVESIKNPAVNDAYEIKQACSEKDTTIRTDEIKAELLSEIVGGKLTEVKFEPNTLNPEINGRIRVHTDDKKYQFTFKVE